MGVSKGVFSGKVVIDLTNDTVTADKLYEGVTAHGADGETITGTMAGKSDNNIAKQVDANAESVAVSADDFPEGITSIRDYAFYESPCSSVEIPSTVTHIGRQSFSYAGSLASVTLPGTITAIGFAAFMSCAKLTDITLPSGLETIDDYAFKGCRLTSLDVPASVKSIGQWAIEGGIPVTVRATTPPSITSGTFVGAPSHIYVPASAVDTYKAATGWSDYSSIIEAITE